MDPFYRKSQFYNLLPATLQDNVLQSLPHGLNTLGFVFSSNNLSSQQNDANMGQIIKGDPWYFE